MSYHPKQSTTGLRWREDTGIEKRCDSCPSGMRYWPLTEEFWNFRQSFNRCRACHTKAKHASQRARYARDAARRLANLDYQRRYRSETSAVRKLKNHHRYWSNPEAERAKARDWYYRNRDRVLERKKLIYWAGKAEAA